MEKTAISLIMSKDMEAVLRITGASMSPLIKPGDRVAARKVDPLALVTGDIAVIDCPGSFVTHRIYRAGRRREPLFWHKGDRGLRLEPVPLEKIIGKVGKIIKANGRTVDLETSFWATANRAIAAYHLGLARPRAWLARRALLPSLRRRPADLLTWPIDSLISLATRDKEKKHV